MLRRLWHRTLALALCFQPVLWGGGVAQAQIWPPADGSSSSAAPGSSDVRDSREPRGGPAPVPSPAPEPLWPDATRSDAVRPDVTARSEGAPIPSAPHTVAVDEPLDPDRYVCGPGDVLELQFWGVQNFRLRATIDLEGRAFVPKVGFLPLGGQTLTQARGALRESVARYYPRLGFDASLVEPRTFRIQLAGAVARPGSYSARAIDRVATVLAAAGGLTPTASRRRIEIRRRDGTSVRADLLLFALTGDVKHDPHLLDGDVVQVPYEDVVASIAGAVNRPGRYELVEARDLAELVALAGGLAPSATRLLPVSVVRRGASDRQDQQLTAFGTGGELPSLALRPEDAVRVPSATELQQSVSVVGALAGAAQSSSPGSTAPDEASATRRLPFVQGDTVRTLLERIGGVGPLADLGGAYILRGETSVPVDLYALVMRRDLSVDKPIELGDTLVVPFKRRNILVEGSVFAPGSYPYNPTYKVEQYLSLAGGRSRNAQPLSEVTLVTPEGQTRPYAPELKVEPGSTLVVPERTFSRPEIVQLILAAAGIVLAGATLVITATK